MSWEKAIQATHSPTKTEEILGQNKATMKVLDLPFILSGICIIEDQTTPMLMYTLVFRNPKLIRVVNTCIK